MSPKKTVGRPSVLLQYGRRCLLQVWQHLPYPPPPTFHVDPGPTAAGAEARHEEPGPEPHGRRPRLRGRHQGPCRGVPRAQHHARVAAPVVLVRHHHDVPLGAGGDQGDGAGRGGVQPRPSSQGLESQAAWSWSWRGTCSSPASSQRSDAGSSTRRPKTT